LRTEGIILFLGDFNAINETNQAIILSNDSNPNPLWLDEDLILANRYQRNLEDLTENLYGTEIINIWISQDIIICNGLMKWPKYNQMTCIHGLGSSVVDYVILDILVYNQIVNFDILNNYELDYDHKHLTLTLNFTMHKTPLRITLVTKGV
jgi:hypothetical protein